MKKTIAVIIALILFVGTAYAAPDLSGLTYDQLVAFQHYITQEIMQREEWKEIKVPAGEWLIGVDLPAGTFSLSAEKSALVAVWTNGIENYSGLRFNEVLDKDSPYGKLELKEGWILQTNSQIIIAPPMIPSF